MATDALDKEFRFYLTNQDDLVTKHDGKVIVIKDCQVLAEYDSHLAAFTETVKHHERGTFLVQMVSEGNEAYTATFYSPVISAG
jgi:hypothetical protein